MVLWSEPSLEETNVDLNYGRVPWLLFSEGLKKLMVQGRKWYPKTLKASPKSSCWLSLQWILQHAAPFFLTDSLYSAKSRMWPPKKSLEKN